MKLKLTSFLAGGAIALCSIVPAISFPSSAHAQLPVAQTILEDLDLSENQQQQLSSLRQSTRSQVQSVLTPEQQSYAQAIILEGADFRESVEKMNITSQQREDLRSIFQSAREDLQTILTPEQRSLLRQTIRAQWRQS
ncbi:MAG: hypothetical protein AAFV85_12640 [Cyanobacteria bacterium J06634_6]